MSSSDDLSGYAPGSFWYYAPNKAAPIAFALLFGGSGAWHFYQCYHFHSWKATGFLPWAAVLFFGGFLARAVGAWLYSNLGVFIGSTVLLFAAPPFYETANFFTLGRILYYVPYHAPMHPGRVASTFAFLQLIVEGFTGSGGARAANPALSPQQQDIGKGLLKTALILQLLCMAAFVTLAGLFQYRCRKAGLLSKNLRDILIILYVSCLLITIRTVYRTVEYFEESIISYTDPSTFPYIMRHEWFFWTFEATLMCINSYMLNILHPSRFLPGNLKLYLAPDGLTEIEGQGFDADRPFIMTVIDPLDLASCCSRKKKVDMWERQAEEEAVAHGVELGNMRPSDSRGKSESTTPLRKDLAPP